MKIIISLLTLGLMLAPTARAATCGDVLDGKIDANDQSLSSDTRKFAFIVASKIEAKGLLKSLEDDGARNGFDTVLDVYAERLVPLRNSVEEQWLADEKENGGAIGLLRQICKNRDDQIFDLYINAYHTLSIRSNE